MCLTGLRLGCCSLIYASPDYKKNIHIISNLHTYCLDKSTIKEVPSANYLGITIDSKLTWSEHVTRVVAKANSVLGFLQCNLKYCPPKIKASCF